MVDDPWGEEVYRHFHVFIAVKCGAQVEVANVEAHVACFWSTEDAVPVELGGRHVHGLCGEFA